MKRILKYIWLWGLLSLCVSSCEEEAAVINPDVSHDKPTEVVIHQDCAASCRQIINRCSL